MPSLIPHAVQYPTDIWDIHILVSVKLQLITAHRKYFKHANDSEIIKIS